MSTEASTKGEGPPLLRFVAGLKQRVAPVLLGVFVLWQAWHMFALNLANMEETLIGMLRSARENDTPVWQKLTATAESEQLLTEWIDPPAEGKPLLARKIGHERPLHRWYGQAAAQEQSWSLFAPNVNEHTSFVAVQLRWDDPARPQPEWTDDGAHPGPTPRPSIVLLSDNEPRDVNSFFRVGRFRLRRYEGNIDALLTRRDKSPEKLIEGWSDTIRTKVNRDGDCMHAYLRWRLREYLAAHPETPEPTQVVLLARTYTIPRPPGPEPWGWELVSVVPLCRWLPQTPLDRDYLPVERFRPATGEYARVMK